MIKTLNDHQRFFSKVVPISNACWLWKGAFSDSGHASFGVKTSTGFKTVAAHRVIYDYLCGGLNPNLICHHICFNPSCVNPAHIKQVSWGEHMKLHPGRTIKAAQVAAYNRKTKTHCIRGHPFNKENTYYYGKRKKRQCRVCQRYRHQEYLQRKQDKSI